MVIRFFGIKLERKVYRIGSSLVFGVLTAVALAFSQFGGVAASEPSPVRSPSVMQRLVVSGIYFNEPDILRDFADRAVIPTMQLLAASTHQFSQSIDAFAQTPNDITLAAARDQWVATHGMWEESAVFRFGPCDSLGDSDLATWPLDLDGIRTVLASNYPLSVETLGDLPKATQGFHAIELLLFGPDGKKSAANFSPRELDFLPALAANLDLKTAAMAQLWSEGGDGRQPYRELFATAGEPGNWAYPSMQAAAEEIVRGAIDCLDGDAVEKLDALAESGDARELPGNYSGTQLKVIEQNLRGIQNAYVAGVPEAKTRGRGMSSFVSGIDANLDRQIQWGLKAVFDELNDIEDPAGGIYSPEAVAQIAEARDAASAAMDILETNVLPLVRDRG